VVSGEELLRRPELDAATAVAALAPRNGPPGSWADDAEVAAEVEAEVKYQGYIEQQQAEIERAARQEHMNLPTDLDYTTLRGLRTEAREKLTHFRPATVGQAGRLSGVTPADMAVLLVHLHQRQHHATPA